MVGRLIGWFIIIIGLYYILVGLLCLFIPNYIRSWINKQSVVSLRLIGITIIVTGGLIIAQLLAYGKLIHLLITLAKP